MAHLSHLCMLHHHHSGWTPALLHWFRGARRSANTLSAAERFDFMQHSAGLY